MNHSSATSITSVQNATIKRALKLRERRGRRQQGRTIIDGLRETRRALESSIPVVELFCQRSRWESDATQALAALAAEQGAQIFVVDDAAYAKLSYGEREEPVVATAETDALTLQELRVPDNPLVCVLDQVEKPGNLGAVLRTLDGVGADALLLSDPVTDIFNPNVIRASQGAVFCVPIAVAEESETREWLSQRGINIFAARVEGAKNYTDADLTRPAAVVFGSEAKGLGPRWSHDSVQPIMIPMLGQVDSLNVASSTAIVLYEAARQRASRG